MKKIFIIGAGGLGREAAWLVERINSRKKEPEWEIQGFLDDDPAKHGCLEGRYPVVGGLQLLGGCSEEIWAVCAIGAAAVRERVVQRAMAYDHVRFATLVDPDAVVSGSEQLGEGSIVCAGAVLTVDIVAGRHVIFDINCTVGHDTALHDFVMIYPGANISGCVTLEQGVEMGTGAQVIQGKRIGRGTIVGAGAVVVRDLPGGCTAVGVPAKPLAQK